MLDTLKLTLQNASSDMLKQHESWQLHTSSDAELKKQDATVFLNKTLDEDKKRTHYNGTIRVDYSHDKRFMNVTVSSLPALMYGTSFEVLKYADMSRIEDAIQAQICDMVDVDLKQAIVTRVDNSTLYTMNEDVAQYIMLLDDISRDEQHRMTKKYFQRETLEFYNRQRTIAFYDKYAKNIKNANEASYTQQNGTRHKELRFEIQNKKATSIRHAFKLQQNLTLRTLQEDYFIQALMTQRKKEFDRHFHFTEEARKITLEDFFTTALFMKAKNKRTALDRTLWLIALQRNFISQEEVRKIMYAAGFSRYQIYRRMKTFEELTSHDIQRTELYEELKSKIHNELAA